MNKSYVLIALLAGFAVLGLLALGCGTASPGERHTGATPAAAEMVMLIDDGEVAPARVELAQDGTGVLLADEPRLTATLTAEAVTLQGEMEDGSLVELEALIQPESPGR